MPDRPDDREEPRFREDAPRSGAAAPPVEEPPYDEAWGRRLLGAVGRFGRWTAILIGGLLLLLAIAVFGITQTGPGRSLVGGFVEDRLAGAIAEGSVRVGNIVGGNLLTRVVVDSFTIEGPEGRTFVALDSVRLEYDPTGFLRGAFVFRHMRVDSGLIQLFQYEDGTWNFQRIFGAEDDGAAPGGTRLAFHDVLLEDGRVVVREPYPPAAVTGEEREAAIREAVRGETIWRIERSDREDRFERVIELTDVRARFPLLRLADPEEPMRIEIEELSTVALAVGRPLDVGDLSGTVTFADTVRAVISHVRLPASELSVEGWVVPGDTTQEYRFEVRGRPIGFSDLQWLPVPVPEEGGGSMDVLIRAEGDVPVIEVSDGDVRVRDTEMRGGFTLALAEPPRFGGIDLSFSPLRLELVGRLLERPLERDGVVHGRLTGSGPIDRLRIDARGTLRPPAGGRASGFEARGGVSLVEPYSFRSLRIGLDGFAPSWLALAGLEADPEGQVTGSLVLDGVPTGRLGFEADLRYERPEVATSAVRGQGAVDLAGEAPSLDASLTLDPLALGALRPWFPDLDLVGLVRGTVAASGRLSDLQARADLQTPRGELQFDGRFDLASEIKTYDAAVTARGIELDQWAEELPATRLAVTGRVEGRGTDPATLEATFDLQVLPSTVAGASVDSSLVRFTLSGGLARVDTLAIDTDVGRARGRGAFGLTEDRSGSLVLDVTVPDLSSWNRWLRPEPSSAAVQEDLFAVFDEPLAGEAEPPADAAAADTLAGSLEARGVVFGSVQDFSFGGRVEGRQLIYDGYATDSLVATLDVAEPRSPDSLTLNATSWGLQAAGTRIDSISGRLQRLGVDSATLSVDVVRDTSLRVAVAGDVTWGDRYAAALQRLRLEAGDHTLELQDRATVAYSDSGLRVQEFVLRGGSGELLRADGTIPRDGEGEFRLVVEQLHLEELLALLPSPPDVRGTLGGELVVRGTAEDPTMEGAFRLEEPSFDSVTYPFASLEFTYGNRQVEGSALLQGEAAPLARLEGTIAADLALVEVEDRLPEEALDLQVMADSVPLQLLEFGLESLVDVGGYAALDVGVTGRPGDLAFDGQVEIRNGAATAPDLGVRFRGATARAVLEGSEARVESFVVHTDPGRAEVTGSLDLSRFTDPGFDLRIVTEDLQAMNTREMSFDAYGTLELGGTYRSPVLTGDVRIADGEIQQEDVLRRGDVIDLSDPEIAALIDTAVVAERQVLQRAQNPFMQNLRADLQVAVGPGFWIRSPVMDVEVAGQGLEVRVDRADDALRVVGTVRLVRGTYVFDRLGVQQELRITSGTIEFVGTPGINPNLDITAEYRTRTGEGPVSIQVHLTGTMEDSRLTLQSEPPLSESDQLCFLAVGVPCAATELGPEAVQRLGQELALGALSSQLSSAIVGDIGLADFFALRSAGGRQPGGAAAGLFAGAELEVGKYLGNDFFVTYTQPLGGYGISEATVEWRFDEDWVLEARTGSILGRRLGFVPASSLEDDRTYGLFIFREWSF